MSRARLGRHIVPIGLGLASVAVGWLLLRDHGATSQEREARAGRVFPSWRRDQVTRLSLSSSSGELGLDRDPTSNAWKLHGSGVPADGAQADHLLGELESAVALRSVEEAVASGLASPRARGEIVMGGLVYVFALGDEAQQPKGGAYLRVRGERPVVVEQRLVTVLLAPPADYRDKLLVAASGAELAELSLAPRGAATFSLVRDAKAEARVRFRLGAGGAYASRGATDAALGALAGLHAERFLEPSVGEAVTRDPSLVVSLRESPGASSTLAFGQPCPGAAGEVAVVRRGNAPVYACVPSTVAAVLARPSSAYEERAAFFARPDEVEEIVVKRALGETLDIARKGGGFRERAPRSRDLDESESESVSGWLTALLGLRGANAAANAAGEPLAVITLHYANIVEEVRFSRVDGKVVALRGDGRTVELDATAGDLASPPSSLTRPLVLLPSSRARALRAYELFCEGRSQRVVREGGYRFATAGPHPIDTALAVAAANALVGARAERWVADERSPRHALSSSCGARLVFEDDAGPAEVTLELGAGATAPVFGALGGQAGVFEAPSALIELVRRPLVSRALFSVDPARVSAVVVRRGGALVKLAPADGGPSLAELVGGLRPLFVARAGVLGADAGEAPVDVEVTLSAAPGVAAERARLRLGRQVTAPEGEIVLCGREGVPFVFAVRAERVAGLRAPSARPSVGSSPTAASPR
ncbi:MAG: DUF4340 domain-containing protein [Myxococcales bacterium]|nr:DUF4340 domain-containing protein [Myxococcales bacterium]